MKKCILWGLLVSTILLLEGCNDDNNKTIDKEKPVIDISKGKFQNCTEVEKGIPFTFTAEISDNEGLGSYSFDIHHNFDHHTHSTEATVTECTLEDKKDAKHPFKLVKTFELSEHPQKHSIEQQFTIPTHFESGNYHFMIKVVDKAGWATMKGLSFKVVNKRK